MATPMIIAEFIREINRQPYQNCLWRWSGSQFKRKLNELLFGRSMRIRLKQFVELHSSYFPQSQLKSILKWVAFTSERYGSGEEFGEGVTFIYSGVRGGIPEYTISIKSRLRTSMILRFPFLQLNGSLKVYSLQSSLSTPSFIMMLFSPSFRTSLLLTSSAGVMQTDSDISKHKINPLNPFILIIILLFPICTPLRLGSSYNQMGGKQSAISEEQLEFLDCRHPTISRVKVASYSEGKTMEVEFWISSGKEIAEWEVAIKGLGSRQSLLLPLSHQVQQKLLCGEGGTCKITYPFYPYLLSDYIATSDHLDRLYENQKLWDLTFHLTDAASLFHSRGSKLGDIRPINIFLSNSQKLKVACRYSWPSQATNYQKTIFDKEITYLAPEEMKQLSFGNNQPKINLQKAESFSVGLTLIDRILFCISQDLYNLPSARFEYKKLQQKHERVRQVQGINPILKAIIILLSHADEQKRITCRQVYEWLIKYKQDILDKNQPRIEHVPDFLQPEVPFEPQQHSRSQSHNMYLESQVVAEFPAKFQHSTALPNEHLSPISVVQQPQQFKRSPIVLTNTIGESSQHIGSRLNARPVDSVAVEHLKLHNPIKQDDFSLTLKRIEEQLQRSRKLFPS